ncbi:MarR family winged helix-turn-helix transcriptional regulator [Paenibacillus sp. CF384]|uniref:MarR family winged helix-turn-helix transcriptional regulator n=1 Tax=Paenibacillus sp. CF384 TaxID=1884382 RepID=UPI000899198C|nr:MarR family transcriptional regulator [Paenibacillus sp. CF384]SDW98861.1 DNA-binding transcriptional regulator, MarR family [Paenibacillus sp. CF384]
MLTNALFQKFVTFISAVHQTTHEMTKDARSIEITALQYKILEYVAINQPVNLSDISDCMHMSMPNTSRELRKLSEKQLCSKTSETEDKRKQSIRLSERGEALMTASFQAAEAQFLKRIETVSDQERQDIERALDLLSSKVFY